MAIENVLERSAPAPIGGWNLPPWIELILRKVRHALMTDEEKKLVELAEFGAATFGAPLFEAKDLDDLESRIDVLLESRELADFYLRVSSNPPVRNDQSLPASMITTITTEDVAHLGIAAPDTYAKALNASVRVLRIRQQLLGKVEPQQMAQVVRTIQDATVLSLCLDHSLSPEIGLILLGWFRAELCSLAFGEMIMSKRRVEPWLSLGIAQRWLYGAEKYLRFMASCPGVDVPVDWVPLNDRLDLRRIHAEHQAERERIKELFEKAEAFGAPIYPPKVFDADD